MARWQVSSSLRHIQGFALLEILFTELHKSAFTATISDYVGSGPGKKNSRYIQSRELA